MENDSTIFNQFNSEEELSKYLNRNTYSNPENGKYDFEQCVFNYEVKFKNLIGEFEEMAIFKRATFKKKCSFEGVRFVKIADFTGCTFELDCNFSKTIFFEDLTIGGFHSYTNFNGAKFKSDTFWGKTFHGIDLSFCTFHKTLDFSKREFHGELQLNNSEFKGDVYFNNSNFKGKVNAWETVFHKNVIFKWANFKSKINLTESKIINGTSDFYGANFEGNGYFYKTGFNVIDLKNSVIEKGIFFLGSEINEARRETYRIIKNEFQKQNNRIECLNYHELEMLEYEKELTGIKKPLRFGVLRFFRDFILVFKGSNKSDKFTLFINRISNGHNVKPFRGIGFTLIFTLLSYLSFIYIIKYENKLEFEYSLKYLDANLKHFFQMLNITNWKFYPFSYDYNFAYAALFIGRIFIGYGIYQTVQAFRKYGKL